MKKIISILTLPFILMVSCKKDLTSINTDPKNPVTYPSSAFFTGAQKNMVDLITTPNVNTGITRLFVQYWCETTYTDESNFDLATRQIPRQVWDGLYRDVIKDLREAKKLIPGDAKTPTEQKNKLAVAEIMEIYAWYFAVTTFGDMPYSQALDGDVKQPKYDDDKVIFADLLTRLDAAIANLVTSGESFGESDIVYHGDVAMWKKFANSLKLKMGMTIADEDNAKAKTVVESAVASGVFTSNADNALFGYQTASPNSNPVFASTVEVGRKDFIATSTIMDKMKAMTDPRIPHFFTTDAAGGYTGGINGASNNYAAFSKPNDDLMEPDYPSLMMSYDEVEFFLAEAVERGYSVGGTAAGHYNNAINASITWWGGTALQATTYLALPSVAYATAAGTYKRKIGEQKWLALYNRGCEGWIEWRRLDWPALVAPATAKSVIPLRLSYPVPEQNLNTANYNAASSAIGGDLVSTKLFWDKL